MIPSGFLDGFRAAVFDLDDTLYAFERNNGPALRALAAEAAPVLGLSEDAFIDEVAASLRAQIARVGRASPCFHSRCVRFANLLEPRGLPLRHALAFTERYWKELFARIEPAPGAADLLRALRGRGVRVGVGTDMTAIEQFRKLEARARRGEGPLLPGGRPVRRRQPPQGRARRGRRGHARPVAADRSGEARGEAGRPVRRVAHRAPRGALAAAPGLPCGVVRAIIPPP